jgi:hypothetical protein
MLHDALLFATCRKAASSVAISGTVLELPPQEYHQLQQLAGDGAGQIVLKLAGELWLLRSEAIEGDALGQEYQQLKQLAGDGAGQIVLKLAGKLR